MVRLVNRPRTGRRGARRRNCGRWSAGKTCAGSRKPYGRVPAAAFVMTWELLRRSGRECHRSRKIRSRMVAGPICLATMALTGAAWADRTNEIAEAARPIEEGVPEVAVYQLQK